jgi:DNA-binding response OmpR family regulator
MVVRRAERKWAMAEKILIVEDDEKIARMIELELVHEGYLAEKAFDGVSGLEKAETGDFALVLLDVMLPGMSGMETLRRLRKSKETPVILLTARDEVVDKVLGLDSGADDYVTKPFAIEELLARIRAAIRKRAKENAGGNGFRTVGASHILVASAPAVSAPAAPSAKVGIGASAPDAPADAPASAPAASAIAPAAAPAASAIAPAAIPDTSASAASAADAPAAAEVRLDPDAHSVTVGGAGVELTHKEFELLSCLMENKGRVLSREALLNNVWGYDYIGETNVVDVYVRFLRSKIDEPFGVKLITTVRGVGYKIG